LSHYGKELVACPREASQEDVDGFKFWRMTVLLAELPAEDPGRGYYTCFLASACSKNERGRRFWMPHTVLADVLGYCEGERAAAIRRAQQAERYARIDDRLIVSRALARRRVELRDADGTIAKVSLDALDLQARARMFVETPRALAPAAPHPGLVHRPPGPGRGLIAAAIQYGHAYVSLSRGYAGSYASGFPDDLAFEEWLPHRRDEPGPQPPRRR
jgi:hypothetical protein